MKWLRTALLVLAVLVVGVLGVFYWVLRTNDGASRAIQVAQSVSGGKLQVRQIDGTLSGPLVLQGVHYRDVERGLLFEAEQVTVDVALPELLRQRVYVRNLALSHASLRLQERPRKPPEPKREVRLDPPIEVVVERFAVDDAAVERNDESILEIDRALLSGEWTDAGILVRQLELDSPQGRLDLRGRVDKERIYVGDATARFRWKVGTKTYAGTLEIACGRESTALRAQMTSPFPVHADASLRQADEALIIDALRIRSEDIAGSLNATGRIDLGSEPIEAAATVRWEGVELPARLAGELLATHGTLEVTGNPSRYSASGELAIGPPDRLSNITLQVSGSTKTIDVRRLSIVQPDGRLTAGGTVQLAPQLQWQISAKARGFDPGAMLPAWDGNLSFSLESEGKLLEKGPQARLKLVGLDGRLRERPVSGAADLTLRPGMVLAGTLLLRSGKSTVSVKGVSAGNAEKLDVSAVFNVASLDDWLPGTSGRIRGRARAHGAWPELALESDVRASNLRVSGASVDRLTLVADVRDFESPTGTVKASASGVSAGRMSWTRVSALASGNPQDHMLSIEAPGEPLGAELVVRGTREGEDWNGTLTELVLDVSQAGRLALQNPAPLRVAKDGIRIGNTCLAGDRVYVCLAGERGTDGALQAQYEIRNLPLEMLVAAAGPKAPVAAEGVIDGAGSIQRQKDGALLGQAKLTSTTGRLLLPEDDEASLLTYSNLVVDANLTGDVARLDVGGTLGESGAIRGHLTASGLQTGSIALGGEAHVTLDSLAAIELFTPRLAEVKGRLDADASLGGTADAPRIAARVRITDTAMEIPDLGIQLRDGDIQVTRDAGGELALSGSIASGDGQLVLKGQQVPDGTLRLSVQGERFLVANIPGARVTISPDLVVSRSPGRVDVEGTVNVPEAQVNLERLPKAGPPRASPDVVVVDAGVPEEKDEARRALPIHAKVTVVLGKSVRLTGYGLNAGLDGRLVVREEAGTPTTGSGEVRVTGTYKAYGQDLTIKKGALLFAGTPIDNPQLNISAYRDVDDNVRPGLTITGTARNPQLTVTSDPPLPEAEALSYLVTGKPLGSVRAEEGDMLQSAARSLGTAAGNLLARNVGQRLGVDEIGIQENDALGGEAAFTIGEYLSPRLFLSYGVGLFTPGQVVTLRYRVSSDVRIQASSTSAETRAAITYEVER